jgi:hypothetical protein
VKHLLCVLSLCGAIVLSSVQAQAQVTYNVEVDAPWLGYMNVFETPDNFGGFVFGSPWGVADLVANFSGTTLTLAPNSVNDPNSFWYLPSGGPGSVGNKIMDANLYVEIPIDTVSGQTVTFEGEVLANTLTSEHVATAFIRDFAPDYSTFNTSTVPLTPGPFSVSLATDPGAGRHVQYGFNFNGRNVWITDVAPYGTVQIEAIADVGIAGDLNGDGAVTGQDFLFWQRGATSPAFDAALLSEWQGAYNGGALAGVTAVPEPASLTLISTIACGLLFRRSRVSA